MKETTDERHKAFLAEAIGLAKENVENGTGGPFGAVIVKDGKVIARGTNRVTTDNDPTAHAEVQAIREACRRLESFQLTGCTLYSSCEPCPMCLGAIYWARPDALYFAATKEDAADIGFDDDFIYREIPLKPEKRTLFTRFEPVETRLAPFELWSSITDKTEY